MMRKLPALGPPVRGGCKMSAKSSNKNDEAKMFIFTKNAPETTFSGGFWRNM